MSTDRLAGNRFGFAPAVHTEVRQPDVPPRLTFRPELDGIRGLAILLVLAAHVHTPGLTAGGDVGVDMFFTLSGFLITGLLLAEVERSGGISLRSFYVRRVRRLGPAFLALFVAAGALTALVGRWPAYPSQAVAALFYVADFARAGGADLGFLAHTWSLSLEEQFYLVWPILLILLPARLRTTVVAVGIALVIVVQQGATTDAADLSPFVRADSILWGCLIALLPTIGFPRWAPLLGWSALAFVVVHPMGHASISLVGVAALLVAAQSPFLRWRPLVRAGEISYGLYLWHFLPAWLLWDRTASGDVLAVAIVGVSSFALALVSERWIEAPFRAKRRSVSVTAVALQVPAQA